MTNHEYYKSITSPSWKICKHFHEKINKNHNFDGMWLYDIFFENVVVILNSNHNSSH